MKRASFWSPQLQNYFLIYLQRWRVVSEKTLGLKIHFVETVSLKRLYIFGITLNLIYTKNFSRRPIQFDLNKLEIEIIYKNFNNQNWLSNIKILNLFKYLSKQGKIDSKDAEKV